ncbi:hypothetical protein GcC1_185040 [Golovinomyces cichoracearum]|uniref:Uncharacterized protein n=1 Tax=Golovinomyces cichoracearum TaxID=62708 RepID=A0A420HKP1_9PEZI|nr:hypothetical protein GcC1_185040 [Golovinomyces cichoracearum]
MGNVLPLPTELVLQTLRELDVSSLVSLIVSTIGDYDQMEKAAHICRLMVTSVRQVAYGCKYVRGVMETAETIGYAVLLGGG